MMLQITNELPVIEVARAVTDYGFMSVTTAITLFGMFLLFRYFLKMFRDMFEKQQGAYIYETPMEQIRVLQSALFNLSKYEVLEQIERIFYENNLHEKEVVKDKISSVLTNIHKDRNSKLDNFKYHGFSLSSFTEYDWIEKIEKICLRQVYLNTSAFNSKQAFAALDIAYDHIKIEFYNNVIAKS